MEAACQAELALEIQEDHNLAEDPEDTQIQQADLVQIQAGLLAVHQSPAAYSQDLHIQLDSAAVLLADSMVAAVTAWSALVLGVLVQACQSLAADHDVQACRSRR